MLLTIAYNSLSLSLSHPELSFQALRERSEEYSFDINA
jgi:hypothetical protein